MRQTQQRDAIRDVFLREDRPLAPLEILAAAQESVPRLGLATVYRNLKRLLAEGWLTEVQLPGEPSRYERAGKHHHHHFQCRGCQRVFEVDGCPKGLDEHAPPGFRVERHELLFVGLCRECA